MHNIHHFLWRLGICFLFLVCIYLSLWNLGTGKIALWDEARHGINAYEMLKTGNPVVNTYCFSNDYWNLKPPMSYWCIMGGYLLVGFNTLGLRLYSAVAFIVVTGITTIYLMRKNRVSAFILLYFTTACNVYFFDYGHFVRNGDADSLYIGIFTLTMIAMLEMESHTNLFFLCGFLFSIAFLTKSWHAAPIAIIGILYMFFTGNWRKHTIKQYLVFIILTIGPIGIWAFCRFRQDGTCFFYNMVQYDLISRTTVGVEGQNADALYYFRYFIGRKSLWIVYLVDLIGSFVYARKRKLQTLISNPKTVGVFLWITVPILLYSCATSKRWWYVWPSIPGMIFLAACFIGRGIAYLKSRRNLQKKQCVACEMLVIFLLCFEIYPIFCNVKKASENSGLDGVQAFVFDYFNRSEAFGKGDYIFVQTKDGDWGGNDPSLQDLVLEVELYGNCYPTEGGINAWENESEDALLLIDEEEVMSHKSELSSYEIYTYKDGWYMYYKNLAE